MTLTLEDIQPDWPNILVVDDDKRIRDLLSRFLWDNHYCAITAGDARLARDILEVIRVDAMIVDVMMPGESGVDFTRAMRDECDIPVLMLTALGESDDRITGLEAGADDYLPKPFEPRELLLRLKSILRRLPSQISDKQSHVQIGHWEFDNIGNILMSDNESISLTQMEGRLLKALLSNSNAPVSREKLADLCELEAGERTIDVQVTRLRKKIEDDPKSPRLLQTVRGKGYMLRV